tara:strand:- start:8 stop:427 length:420 start_codon:yes stop_codon:yes gene_type:complete
MKNDIQNLTLKIVSPYHQHQVKLIVDGVKSNIAWLSTKYIAICKTDGIGEVIKIRWSQTGKRVKLILRPVIDLKKSEFEMDSISKDAIIFLNQTAYLPYNNRESHIGSIQYRDILKIFEWHMNIFGLSKELWVNKNTLD